MATDTPYIIILYMYIPGARQPYQNCGDAVRDFVLIATEYGQALHENDGEKC